MNRKEYNGWTNYETWNAALWIGEGDASYWDERAGEVCAREDDDDAATCRLADEMKDSHEENAPDLGASFYSDMLNAALSEVDWYEIARHYVDDYRSENPREDDAAVEEGADND